VTTTFADLGVPAPMCRILSDHGINDAFPIQEATLPDGLAGRDLCGRAPTGSGKTIAFGIPLVTRIGTAAPKRPRALVLVPTRELAAQVRDELIMLAGPKGASVEAFYGGNGFDRQLKALRRGVDIAVACPGRLADLINRGDVRLDAVQVVVIDEADRMADMGFLPEVKRLLDQVPDDRQTLLFSATLDGAVDELIRRYQHNPARHELADDPDDGARVEHYFWAVSRDERITLCAKLVSQLGPTIVFCRTKRGADRVARQLEAAGVRAAAIHGDRSQGQRERALAAFQRGQVDALVATDVAARGIHVDDVAGVIHLDPPADEKDYIHRSGRTGRAGATGVVVSFVAPELRKDVKRMQRILGFPEGLTSPDAADLPVIERPARKPAPVGRIERGERDERTARPGGSSRPRRPRPGQAVAGKAGRRPRDAAASKRSAGPTSSGPKSGGPKSTGPKSGGSRSTGPKAGASAENRKARRAHLQPGGAGAASTRSTRPGADKGKRRQPSGTRSH
jgi:superfamily II DNA/RNA helicase